MLKFDFQAYHWCAPLKSKVAMKILRILGFNGLHIKNIEINKLSLIFLI